MSFSGALTAGKWSRCSEDLSREDINKLCGEISEATVGMNDNGYHGGMKRFRAWMKRGATAKDDETYRDWMKSKKASFIYQVLQRRTARCGGYQGSFASQVLPFREH